jgi:8-oxo-dGTP diphosphatase
MTDAAGRTPTLRVVAAVLFDADGRVLIAQRPAGKHMAGLWEFPGGKIAPGERPEQALRRELDEELGVQLDRCRWLLDLSHDYPDRRVELAVWVVEAHGVPRSLEGQALKWVRPGDLRGERLLPADEPIVDALVKLDKVVAHGSGNRITGHSTR